MSDFDERDASDDEPELNEEEVLEQLQELHRQLAERQKDEEVTPSLLEPPKKLIICATRRPVRLEKPFGEASFQYEESKSGLTSAVHALQNDGVECRWVAWPGCAVEKTSQEGVRQRLEDDFNCRPVFLERDLVEAFYARFCHGVLWPLFHSLPTDVTGRTDLYEAYVQANQKYLEAVALEYQEGDVVLVHDYELMLLPAMIRGRFPDAPVGFFCHCPFPSSEYYRMLPAREALLRGALGADLISFNHFDYVRHFLNACMRVRSRRPVVLWCLHFIQTTRVHLAMTWVVSFSISRPFGRSRATNAPRRLLLFMRFEDPRKPISIYFNVPGALMKPCLAVYDTLRTLECPVTTVNLGLATGMGAFLCGAGTKGMRYALPNARFLMQRTGLDDPYQGQASDIGLMVRENLRDNDRMAR